jgi:hypothetical protein
MTRDAFNHTLLHCPMLLREHCLEQRLGVLLGWWWRRNDHRSSLRTTTRSTTAWCQLPGSSGGADLFLDSAYRGRVYRAGALSVGTSGVHLSTLPDVSTARHDSRFQTGTRTVTQADFTYAITPDTISITDTGKGPLPVASDIEAVLRKIEYWQQRSIAGFKIPAPRRAWRLGRDSVGSSAGIVVCLARNR